MALPCGKNSGLHPIVWPHLPARLTTPGTQIYHPRAMGQRWDRVSDRKIALSTAILLLCATVLLGSCDRPSDRSAAPASSPPASQPASQPSSSRPTVASLVPAATDLIVGIGAGDHLVAVSNWDADRPETKSLPKAGDYRTVDWERLAQVRPAVMIVQFRPDKMPAGLAERADSLSIKLVNVKINSLADLYDTLQQLGDAIGEPQKADAAARRLRDELDTVKARVAGKPRVRTLITRAEPSANLACVGGGNFLDEILTIAGGENVLAGGENSYPTIDREKLLSLNPDVVLALMPGEAPQVIKRAKDFWQSVPQVSAVKSGRVFILTDSYLLLPGLSVSKIADEFAHRLHPDATAEGGR
jgi:iron complex transport system substrate-binding protein